MRCLFLGVHRPQRSPSQRFRMEQFFPLLEARGHSVDYRWLLDEGDDHLFYSPRNFVKKAMLVARSAARSWANTAQPYDRVFVQREAFFLGGAFFERRLRTQKLIYDFDDALWIRDVSEGNRLMAPLKNVHKPAQLMALADMVLAGNNYLADYARQFSVNVEVIPTVVDTDRLTPAQRTGLFTVGWMGSPSTSKYVRPLLPLVHRAVGDARVGEAWSEAIEVAALQSFDVGLMPLPNDAWTMGKCGFKALQYMAVGAVPVVSPVGVNRTIVTHGHDGFFAESREDFARAIATLRDPMVRERMAKNARDTVVAKWSVKAWGDRWVDLVTG